VSEQLLQRTRALEELADTRLLQRLSAQLIEGHDSTSLYETIVDAAMSIMRSDFASLQMLHPDRGNGGELQLIASRGFNDEAKTFWEWVGKGRVSPCAVALGTGTRVIAADMERCEFLDRTLLDYGVLAAQSTPLVSRGGRMLGMISTHWRRPHMPSERDLRLLDILARQAADLMERTQADEALRQSESRLKEADRRKDEFLAMLAHELRNPLAPLRTCIELIRLAGDTPDAVASVRTMMEEQVGHMVRLIDDLLDVSRITSGKIRLQRERAALAPLLDAATELHREAFQSAGVSLVVDRPDRPVFLEADPTRFIQVLSNVLHNAVKFTNAGGRVQVSTAVTDAGGDGPGELTLRVTDTGIGISSEMLPRVFDLFSQDEGAIRRADDGLGIGLALARCLMELHGGSIQAESGGPGLGSTFTIRLPVAASAALPEPVAPPVVTARVRRRVVAIDDNVSAATAMRRLVRALGGECWVAGDGETGLKQVAAVRPDMIFIDIGMPGIDGYETCRRIRREVGPEVVVVAMTGWGREQDKAAAARAGFDLHLTKPADPFVLEGLLTDPDIRRFIPDRPTI
jgi:signal transduction histidine kinase/ActR/RegA family two-component response regulator